MRVAAGEEVGLGDPHAVPIAARLNLCEWNDHCVESLSVRVQVVNAAWFGSFQGRRFVVPNLPRPPHAGPFAVEVLDLPQALGEAGFARASHAPQPKDGAPRPLLLHQGLPKRAVYHMRPESLLVKLNASRVSVPALHSVTPEVVGQMGSRTPDSSGRTVVRRGHCRMNPAFPFPAGSSGQ